MDIKTALLENAAKVEQALPAYLETPDPALETLYDAMRYSALGGGKRIRAFLVMEFCRLFGGTEEAALPFACAMECVHASSLIHDDMPCMDNDDYRRGKLTNHKVYGDNIALLAGDALITKGYEIAASNPAVSWASALAGAKTILRYAGGEGMMGGQEIDLLAEKKAPDFPLLLKMHAKKTGALIRASAMLGCHAAGIVNENDSRIADASVYAAGIGLAFQIIDDILDVEGDAAVLGKATHADAKEGKTTFLSFMDVPAARRYAQVETDKAIAAIGEYPGSATLIELARYLLARDH
ncbi:MAG: polyprenyl synthetase family protein [Ruminococcus sp.]|nr:polyprenyl synthetase family protein [Candidatus Apopatosoma intestinale]